MLNTALNWLVLSAVSKYRWVLLICTELWINCNALWVHVTGGNLHQWQSPCTAIMAVCDIVILGRTLWISQISRCLCKTNEQLTEILAYDLFSELHSFIHTMKWTLMQMIVDSGNTDASVLTCFIMKFAEYDKIYCILTHLPLVPHIYALWIRSALDQIMPCRLFGAMPLSKPILGYCQLDP